MADLSFKPVARGQATSTTTTSVLIASYTPRSSNCVLNVIARAVAWDSLNSKAATFVITATFAKVAGSLSQIGSGNTTLDSKIEAVCAATLPAVQSDGSGNIVCSSHQSQSATIFWDCVLDVVEYEFV